jgi:hypothetical protein
MNMYLFEWSPEKRNFLVESPQSDDGEFLPPYSELPVTTGFSTTVIEGTQPLDRICTMSGNDLIVKTTLYHALRSFLGGHCAVPVLVRCGDVLYDYVCIIPQNLHFVLHRDAATFREIKGHVYAVDEWVLDYDSLPVDAIFCSSPRHWIISEDARRVISSFTGFELIPVLVKKDHHD